LPGRGGREGLLDRAADQVDAVGRVAGGQDGVADLALAVHRRVEELVPRPGLLARGALPPLQRQGQRHGHHRAPAPDTALGQGAGNPAADAVADGIDQGQQTDLVGHGVPEGPVDDAAVSGAQRQLGTGRSRRRLGAGRGRRRIAAQAAWKPSGQHADVVPQPGAAPGVGDADAQQHRGDAPSHGFTITGERRRSSAPERSAVTDPGSRPDLMGRRVGLDFRDLRRRYALMVTGRT